MSTKKLKVLYISTPSFFDYDLSLLPKLNEEVDLVYLLDIAPHERNKSALSIQTPLNKNGIYNSGIYPEFSQFKSIKKINTKIINRASSKTATLGNIILQIKILFFILKTNPDIIHFNNLFNHKFFLVSLFLNRQKLFLTVHDPIPHSSDTQKRFERVRNMNFKTVKNICLLNKSQLSEFKKAYSKRYKFKNIFISSMGTYDYLSSDYQKQPKSKPKFNILFFGRIEPYKGVDLLLEAVNLLDDPNKINLTIAGKGEYWFDRTKYQNQNFINFIDKYIPHTELNQMIVNADLVVCPYKDGTQSGVIMTSLALDTPVLASSVGGIPEVIIEGQTGFLVPPNDSKALSNKIQDLINFPEKIRHAKTGIQKSKKEGLLSWSRIAKQLSEYYHTIHEK